jgi:hypothetical protein
MNARPDGFAIGQDPEVGKEEKVEGCSKCGRTWPAVRFSRYTAACNIGEFMLGGEPPPPLCDACWPKPESELDAKIAEAQGVSTAPALIRSVEVTGIDSRTNVVSFKYATHVGSSELLTTLLNVAFKGKNPGEFTWYVYRDVPVAIAEAWFAAPSHGESYGKFFAAQIKNSYDSERKV